MHGVCVQKVSGRDLLGELARDSSGMAAAELVDGRGQSNGETFAFPVRGNDLCVETIRTGKERVPVIRVPAPAVPDPQ
ncbi:hypothetical protein GCM10009611_11950 [Arthrobacter roseus]